MTNKEKYMELWYKTRDTRIEMDIALSEWQRPIAVQDPYYERRYFNAKEKYEKIKVKLDSLVHNYYFHGDEPYMEEEVVAN